MHINLTEEAYIVESIVRHFPEDGEIKLTIKWMGYADVSDEPLSSMYEQI